MEKVGLYKTTVGKFVFNEFIIFLSQVIVFFMVAVFTSNFLNSEDKLAKFSEQKINDGTLSELGLTFLAILIVIGLFSTIGRVFENKYVEYYVNEILCEMPKTIYFFGSSITGVMVAVSLFLHLNSSTSEASAEGFTLLTVLFSVVTFVYGCAFSYAFKRKTHICPKLNSRGNKGDEVKDQVHSIIQSPHKYRLVYFLYRLGEGNDESSYIELHLKKMNEVVMLKFIQPIHLEVKRGFDGNISGMEILDVRSRQIDNIGVEVRSFEQDSSISFLAKEVIKINA